jgi:hypothetical protein
MGDLARRRTRRLGLGSALAGLLVVLAGAGPRADENPWVLLDDRVLASLAELAATEAACGGDRGPAERQLCLAGQRHGRGFAAGPRTTFLDGLVMFLDSHRQLHMGGDLARGTRLDLVARPRALLRGRGEVFLLLRYRM